MKITYIFHSSFAIETEHCIMVFDYWMDPSGIFPKLLESEKPIYVFASHFHEDHFNRNIFVWKDTKTDISYILSKDILKHRRAQKNEANIWMAKGGTWDDGTIHVTATGSNDSGVSWIVETEGKRIFHAGDLNNWYASFLTGNYHGGIIHSAELDIDVNTEKEEKRFLGELKDIHKITDSFDIVMFPIDGRIGNGYTNGARIFIDKFNVELFIPMHFTTCGFESVWKMKKFTDAKGIEFWNISHEGESIEI